MGSAAEGDGEGDGDGPGDGAAQPTTSGTASIRAPDKRITTDKYIAGDNTFFFMSSPFFLCFGDLILHSAHINSLTH